MFSAPLFGLDRPPGFHYHRACYGRFGSGSKSRLLRRVAGNVEPPSRAERGFRWTSSLCGPSRMRNLHYDSRNLARLTLSLVQ